MTQWPDKNLDAFGKFDLINSSVGALNPRYQRAGWRIDAFKLGSTRAATEGGAATAAKQQWLTSVPSAKGPEGPLLLRRIAQASGC